MGVTAKKWWFWVIVVILVIVLIPKNSAKKVGEVSTSSSSTTVSSSTKASSLATTAPKKETLKEQKFGVGDIVDQKDIRVTLNDVYETQGNQFIEPEDGNIYVLCDFTIENNSSKEISVSSLLCFDAYVDDFSTSLSIGALAADSSKSQLDGSVAAGKKMTGVVGYEVPSNWKELEIRFSPDFWVGEDIIFVAYH